MRRIYKIAFASLFAIALSGSLFAQKNFFTKVGETKTVSTTGQRIIVPDKFYTSSLDVPGIKEFLWSLPSEQSLGNNRTQAPVLELPMPDGSIAKFRVWESSVQAPELQAKFPEIKTFLGQGIDDPYATIRFDFNPYFGFSAQILSPKGRVYIDPYARWDVNNYISYYQQDNKKRRSFICSVEDNDIPIVLPRINAGPCVGTQLRTYRLAIGCTSQYAASVGAGLAGPTHAAIVASVNRITGIYEVELSVRMVLVANNDLIEYLAEPDPYSNSIGNAELTTNQNNTDAVIGSANYDIGHLFTSDDNGLAQIGCVCTNAKAKGATGSPNLIGDGFDVDFVAHEMGHQFGATHSYNSNQCASPGGSYEPGGGSTIMAYAGICAPNDNIQPNSDPVFHAVSFDEISTFITSGQGVSCAVSTPTGNTLPVITAMNNNNISIPVGTPFTLTATATDANGDPITYNWEGWDEGPAGPWTSAGESTTRPLFRSRLPKTTGSRTFPDIRVIAANYPELSAPSAMNGLRGEVLPQVPRTMKFKLTVRDNRAGGGGVVSGGDGCQSGFTGIFQVNVVDNSGNLNSPFRVLSPNGGDNFPGGSSQTITWDVVGTDAAPISVSNVKISLSTDAGLTYPTVLIASTPNDGTESIPLPNVATTTARIKIEAVGNIFFDISNSNFTITASASGFTFNNPAAATAACPAPATMSVTLGTTSVSGFSNPITLSATAGVPPGTTVSFSPNPVSPGSSSTVTLNNANTLSAGSYVITITGTATGAITQTRDITFTINPGSNPSITLQPQPQTVCAGTNASFSVTATSATSYQWQVNTGSGFVNISGATSSSYTAAAVTAIQNGHQYRVIINNGQCGSTTSNAAALTVQTAPAITAQPQSQTLCSGSNATFNVTATGTNITYQWQVNTGSGFTDIGGAIAAGYTQNSITAAMNNNQYRVVISGTCAPVATSNAATLTVVSPVTVTAQPSNVILCATGNASFTVTGSGSGVLYQWQVSTDGGNNYTNINGATAATLNVNAVTAAMNNNRYRALLSNATCTTPVASNGAVLTVNANPAIPTITIGGAATFCIGGSVVLTSSAATGNQWLKDGVAISGQTAISYTATASGSYTVMVTNATNCSATSITTVITVNPAPPKPTITQTGNQLSSSAVTGNQWFKDGVLIAGATGQNYTPTTTGNYTVQVTVSGCTSPMSDAVNVTVTSVNDPVLQVAVTIFPNPVKDVINIKISGNRKITIQLYDLAGRKIVIKEKLTGIYQLPAAYLVQGCYILLVTDETTKKSFTKLLFKE